MRAVCLVAFAVLATLVSSCSLLGLDRFHVQGCAAGGCDALNRRDGLDPAGCRVWQCDATGQYCELAARRDHDHDGYVSAVCPGGNDCNDDVASIAPNATETCDGVDNDCNGYIDDARAGAATASVTVVSGAPSPSFVAYGSADDGVLVSWRASGAAQLAAVSQIDSAATGHDMTGSTNQDPTMPFVSASATTGCPDGAVTSLAPTLCSSTGTCPSTLHCVMAPDGTHVCELPVTNHVPRPATECTTHAQCQDGVVCNGYEVCDPTGTAPVDTHGCRAAMPTTPCGTGRCIETSAQCVAPMAGACTFGDAALAAFSPTDYLVAPIATDGCAAGRVRVGALDPTASTPSIVMWGDDRFTTTWLGVDVDTMSCTGASYPSGSMHGASGISVAALPLDAAHDRPLPQALAVWRATPLCTGTCTPPASAPVEVIGLWHEVGRVASSPIQWIDGSDNGRPQRLVDAAASQRPSVTAWSLADGTAGYAIAYARAGGGVALSLVHAFTSSPTMPLAPACPASPACLEADPSGQSITQIANTATTPSRTTPSLGAPIPETIAMGEMPTNDVSIATGASSGATVTLAIAWATASNVVIERASFDPHTNMLTEGMTVRLTASGATDVALVHVAAGIVDPGPTMRPAGGFVVTWATASGTFAARLADLDGMPVAPGVVHLGDATDHPRAFVDVVPGTGSAAATSRARVIAHRGAEFVAFPFVCGPPA
jgi:hypothetical protein